MVDFKKIKTIPISKRENKVSIKDFAKPKSKFTPPQDKSLEELAEEVIKSYRNHKKVVAMMGAHVVKCGLSLYVIELMKKGVISHIALNGAGSIHDFEIALIGETSEDVGKNILNGTFGMAEETGQMMNKAIKKGKFGYGKTIGQMITKKKFKYKEYSIQYWGYRLGIPVTVHVAIGTDIIHQHPSCDGAAIGKKSYQDFKIFTDTISRLEKGVLLNIGSAVILPEVFLKSLSIARNLGYKVEDFCRANLDMIDSYRPRLNVLERPSKKGKAFNIQGRHEQTVPALYYLIKKYL